MKTYRNALPAQTADRIAARQRMQRGGHGLVLMAQGDRPVREVGQVAESVGHWWENLRRGQNAIYGSMLRFIDVSVKLGAPKEVLLQIPALIAWYIEDQYGPTDTQEIKIAA